MIIRPIGVSIVDIEVGLDLTHGRGSVIRKIEKRNTTKTKARKNIKRTKRRRKIRNTKSNHVN